MITEIVGWKRIVELMHPRVIDTDVDPAIGELLEVELPPDPDYGLDAFGEFVHDFDKLPPPVPRSACFLKSAAALDASSC